MMDTSIDTIGEDDFKTLLEASFKKNGSNQIIKGVITKILSDKVLVDVGRKEDGELDISEIKNQDEELLYKTGDTIEVAIIGFRNERPRISHTQALRNKSKNDFLAKYKNNFEDLIITGNIVKKNKGGFIILADEVEFFLPKSQSMLNPTANLIGKKVDAKVVKIEDDNIVVSRVELIKDKRTNKDAKIAEYLKDNKIVTGVVTNIVSYGMFVEFDEIIGLVHYNEISYKGSVNPSKFFKVGDKVDVKVIGYEAQKGHVTLSIKSTMSDPWEDLSELGVGDIIMVTVSNIEKYGAFVDIGNDIEGLLHISEMSWNKNLTNPKEVLNVGDEINVEIKEISIKDKKLRVSLKNLLPKPMDGFVEKYKIGDVAKGKVVEVKEFGAFISIDGIEGLLANQNCDWKKSVKCKDFLTIGEEISVLILDIDKAKEKVSLSIKDIQDSPAKEFGLSHVLGDVVEGTIKDIKDFGVFVDLKGFEALIKKEDLFPLKAEELVVGAPIEGVVSMIDGRDNKIRLSIKRLQKSKDRDAMNRFNGEDKITLGDMIKDKM